MSEKEAASQEDRDTGAGSGSNGGHDASDWDAIVEALRGLKFGVVSVVVQDGVVVQIDRTEKRRVRRKRQ